MNQQQRKKIEENRKHMDLMNNKTLNSLDVRK